MTDIILRGFSEKEAAAMFTEAGYPVSTRPIQRERERGRITYRLITGKVRFTEADLIAWLDSAKVQAKPPPRTDNGTDGPVSNEVIDLLADAALNRLLKRRSKKKTAPPDKAVL